MLMIANDDIRLSLFQYFLISYNNLYSNQFQRQGAKPFKINGSIFEAKRSCNKNGEHTQIENAEPKNGDSLF